MLIDSHCHLDMKDFNNDRIQVIERAQSEGIVHMVTIGIDVASSEAALALAREYPFISATVGCHPHDADECNTLEVEKLASLALEPEVVAWGEIGLDYFRNYSEKENQRKIFKEQLDLAHTANLPVIIHDRDAHDEVYALLKKMGKGKRKRGDPLLFRRQGFGGSFYEFRVLHIDSRYGHLQKRPFCQRGGGKHSAGSDVGGNRCPFSGPRPQTGETK